MEKGQIYHKDQFLANVAAKLGRERRTEAVIKPTWKRQPQWNVLKDASQDELVDVLKKQCEVIHTQVFEVDTSSLKDKIDAILEQYEASSVITWNDKRFADYGVEQYLFEQLTSEGKEVHKWDLSVGHENIIQAEKADVGITFSDMTLAESGTVVLFSDADKGRSVSLLPKTYIAIIPKSTIVPRMTQATKHISNLVKAGELVPSCVNFISGPSNSADIELNLVVGVHGPVKASYIIVNDK
ncbi:LutC/YkgG family protein [Litchfieldia salsa]|uniref:Lactate utilization protein C n=1 Tax=Litchfieldia salsa TaxID=930152 RepID=A0A1H0Q8W5_9BACI|nr:lactate utilization protein C [Litchfieldia salsa]SDP13764.1 L-lactate dehydrogenase complex protein LldG [Litchfieldia salsa]